MSHPILALCAGYGGLDDAVMQVLDAHIAAYAEFDPAAASIMAHHHPDVPNLWDLTKIVWADLPPVEIVTAGFPCQPFSVAGKRQGANDERHLWPYIAEGIRVLRPRLVVLENVRGLLSGQGEPDPDDVAELDEKAHHWQRVIDWTIAPKLRKARSRGQTDRIARLEADTVRLTEQRRRAVDAVRRERRRLVRAVGAVLRDLANLGYDARWYGLRAADVGAAHGRFRVFVIAAPAGHADVAGLEGRRAGGERADERAAGPDGVGAGAGGLSLLPAPTSSDTNGAGAHGQGGMDLRTSVSLLPTPACNDMGEGKTVEAWDARTDRMKAAHGNGNGHGKSLAIEAQRLLPTPRATDGTKGGPNQRGSSGDLMLPSAVQMLPTPRATRGGSSTETVNLLPTPTSSDAKASGSAGYGGNEFCTLTDATVRQPGRWGDYGPAIARWEHVIGRPAPDPTEPGRNGAPRLSPRFVEWLMGLPEGHVTDVPGITRNHALKALGNGVVPQQAAAALRAYIADETHAQQRSA